MASLQRTGGLIAALLAVIALFLGATYVGGSAMSALQQGFQENVTFTKKDFVPYSERRRWVPHRHRCYENFGFLGLSIAREQCDDDKEGEH